MGYPINLDLDSRPVLVVGAGAVATRRIERLLEERAAVTVVSPDASDTIVAWAETGKLVWHRRAYRAGDCDGFSLVFATTDDAALNQQICRDASERGALSNSATEAGSDFAIPSRIRRGPLQLAIDTSGAAPALSRQLRLALQDWLGDEWGEAARILGALRSTLSTHPAPRTRRDIQRQAASELIEVLRRGDDLSAWLDALVRAHGIELSVTEIAAIIGSARPS